MIRKIKIEVKSRNNRRSKKIKANQQSKKNAEKKQRDKTTTKNQQQTNKQSLSTWPKANMNLDFRIKNSA